ncbi:MAG: ABC transporter substrate-binding protein [Betaproteobacteria bacterium]
MTQVSDQVLLDLAPSGKLRFAINFGNPVLVQRDPSGQPKGITVDLAKELSLRLGVTPEFVSYDAAGKVFAAIADGAWDVAFLARDPVRAEQILFTPPYVVIEGSYLVGAESSFQHIDDLDQPGVRIAVGQGAAYDLYLTRALKHATLVRFDTSAGAIELFQSEGLNAAAGVRQPLQEAADARPGLRVIPGRFTSIEQAMGTLAGREAGHQFLVDFIAEMKASGFVAAALLRHGEKTAQVAP